MRQDVEQMKKLRIAEGNSVSRWGLWGLNPGSLHTGLGVVSRLKAQRRTSLFSLISAWGLHQPHGVLLRR